MDGPGWRSLIVGPIGDACFDIDQSYSWPHMPFRIDGVDGVYVGPYTFECGHGCYGGAASHGFGLSREEHTLCGLAENFVGMQSAEERAQFLRQRIFAALREADIVFIWCEGGKLDARGALEIGYASGLAGKSIVLGTPHRRLADPLIAASADRLIDAGSPEEAVSLCMALVARWGLDPTTWKQAG